MMITRRKTYTIRTRDWKLLVRLFVICEPVCLLVGITVLNHRVFDLQGKVHTSMHSLLRLPHRGAQLDQRINSFVDPSDEGLKIVFAVESPFRLVDEKAGGLLSATPPLIHSPMMVKRFWWKGRSEVRSLGETPWFLQFR